MYTLYQDQFLEKHDFPDSTLPTKTLVIASTPRCGSHMLGHLLHETRAFGFPLEYVNPRNLKKWKRLLELEDTEQVLERLKERRTSPNGVFGIKFHYSHLEMVGGIDNVLKNFPYPFFVLLTRNDPLRQAVSYSMARQTGVWIAGQEAVSTNPEYDFADIDHCLRENLRDNASWRYVLASRGCRYIHMNFEDVRSDPTNAVQRIADFMGVGLTPGQLPAQAATEKQSSNLNKEWTERYINDCQPGSQLLPTPSPGITTRIRRKLGRVLENS